MNYLTHYLEAVIYLLIASFPAGFHILIGFRYSKSIAIHGIINVLLALLLTICFKLKNINIFIVSKWYFLIAILCAVVGILGEYGIAQAFYYFKNKKFTHKIKIPAYENAEYYQVIWVIIQSAFEEIVLRSCLYYILIQYFGITNPIICIIILTLIFALNHCYSGKEAVIEKTFSGGLIATLFVITNGNIVFAILPHVLINVTYFLLAKKGRTT